MTLASGRFRGARIWRRQVVNPHIFIAASSFVAKLENNARRRWLSKKSNQMGRRKNQHLFGGGVGIKWDNLLQDGHM
jgi:hypothetical protein